MVKIKNKTHKAHIRYNQDPNNMFTEGNPKS